MRVPIAGGVGWWRAWDSRIEPLVGASAILFTVGHSNHSWESFKPLLLDHVVEVLVDVRSNPVSRFAPFANRRKLTGLLESVGIDYAFMGGPLGGKPADPSMYDAAGRPDYDRMRSLDGFKDAIAELAGMAARRPTAILCAEEDPAQCHRLLLLGPPLSEHGIALRHIRRDGRVQETAEVSPSQRAIQLVQGALPLE